jgi:acetyl-CoA C-acetyltransferase
MPIPRQADGRVRRGQRADYQLTREAQDAYAIRSLARANDAIGSGAFDKEIVAVTLSGRGGDTVVETDEQPGKA